MIEHGDEGALGLVVNRSSPLTLKDLARGQSLKVAAHREADAIFLGGPVEPNRGFALHDCSTVPEKIDVCEGLYLSVTLEALRPLLMDPVTRLRFCLGYAGWGPRQLEQEISTGAWLFAEPDGAPVFAVEPDRLWDATLRKMGVDPVMLLPGGGMH